MHCILGVHFMRTSLKGVLAISVALTLVACGNVSHEVAKDGRSAGQLVWPAPENTTPMHKGGTFPNLANLRQVRAGLDKQQVSDLIGYPHFSEGVWSVREWNYVFNFRKPGSDEVTVCQYKVLFDADRMARSFYWKPESCAALLEERKSAASLAQKDAPHRFTFSADALFAFGKADMAHITPEGRNAVANLAAELRERMGQVRSVRITGYTDRLGSAAYNQQLSERRARAVMAALITDGLPIGKIRADGLGERNPVTECPDGPHAQLVACLAPDRRVEVKVEQ
jgi:OOP family OmpA-OmpF porin